MTSSFIILISFASAASLSQEEKNRSRGSPILPLLLCGVSMEKRMSPVEGAHLLVDGVPMTKTHTFKSMFIFIFHFSLLSRHFPFFHVPCSAGAPR